MLQRVCLELEIFSNGVLFESIGRVSSRYRSIVCDAPARAYLLCVKQHMGYDNSAHCFIKIFQKTNRLLFKVSKPIILREKKNTFQACGELLSTV